MATRIPQQVSQDEDCQGDDLPTGLNDAHNLGLLLDDVHLLAEDTVVPASSSDNGVARISSEDYKENLRKMARKLLAEKIGNIPTRCWQHIDETHNDSLDLSTRLAYELGLHVSSMPNFSQQIGAMVALADSCRNMRTERLVDSLFLLDEISVVKDILQIAISPEGKRGRPASGSQLDVDRTRSSSDPSKESDRDGKGRCASLNGFASEASEHEDPLTESFNSNISGFSQGRLYDAPAGYFYSLESKIFWESIVGDRDKKDTKDFKTATEELFKEDPTFVNEKIPRILKFIFSIFDIKMTPWTTQYLLKDQFRSIVCWFGRATKEEGGCFREIALIIEKSLVKRVRNGKVFRDSWFAGGITSDEAFSALGKNGCKEGDFLIRFSESMASRGCFVLSFITSEEEAIEEEDATEVKEVVIENDPFKKQLTLGTQTFGNLVELVNQCQKEAFSEDNVLLANPCPEVGMKAICHSYAKVKKPGAAAKKSTK